MTGFSGYTVLWWELTSGGAERYTKYQTPPLACANENNNTPHTSGQTDPKSRRPPSLPFAAALRSIHAHHKK